MRARVHAVAPRCDVASLLRRAAAARCRLARARTATPRTAPAVANLDQALRPTFFAAALRKLGGAHFHGTTRMSVTAAATRDAAGGRGHHHHRRLARPCAATTACVETNDQDGGREVVLLGRELAVALRYGKMIRRVAEEPEPSGCSRRRWAAPGRRWEVAAPFACIERDGRRPSVGGARASEYRVTWAEDRPSQAPAQARPLRACATGAATRRCWSWTAT